LLIILSTVSIVDICDLNSAQLLILTIRIADDNYC